MVFHDSVTVQQDSNNYQNEENLYFVQVAAASGDARRALDICRHAIEVAEQAGAETVTSLHIQRAITDMYRSIKTKAIM